MIGGAFFLKKEEEPRDIPAGARVTKQSAIKNQKLGDSKFFRGRIVSSANGRLAFFKEDGTLLKEHKEVFANWIATAPNEEFLIVGNAYVEIRKML